MTLDDLLVLYDAPKTGDDMLKVLQLVMTADDLTDNDRAAVATGFVIGCSYALAKSNEGDMRSAARNLIRLQKEWQASGLL